MQASPPRVRLRFCALLTLFLLLPLALPLRALAQSQSATQEGEQRLATKYFTILYPNGEEKTAAWYADFADDVNVAVAEMLGQEPVRGLTLHIYATEDDYVAANPVAQNEPGIMAHAIPDKKEVGVAVERLRQVEPEIARQSFRHEMTHVVAGALSNQKLPIGFQEGLAQYNELSTSRAQSSMEAMRSDQETGVPLLSWPELNDRAAFMRNPGLSYPESYSMMAFLADKYGMGAFSRFLTGLRDGKEWPRAINDAYGKAVDALEVEWRVYLPGFIKDGWQQNLLTAYDLSPGVALYQAGRFTEAADHFMQSEKLYHDLGRTAREKAASDYLARSTQAEQADQFATQARKSLEAYDYTAARGVAQSAANTFASLDLKAQQDIAAETAKLAQRGLEAIAALNNAQVSLQKFDIPGARAEARAASQTFAELGDKARAGAANKIVSDMSLLVTSVGYGALGVGVLAVLAGGIIAMRARGRMAREQAQKRLPGESASWL